MIATKSLLTSTLLLTLAGRGLAALPGDATAHQRIVDSDLVVVARAAEGASGSYSLEVREVLVDRRGLAADLAEYVVGDPIPGSSVVGDRLPIPGDTDVVLFLTVTGTRSLGYAGCWTNGMVPLDRALEECVVPRYEFASMTPEEFLDGLRRLATELGRFEPLVAAYRSAEGSRHPFCFFDKVRLLELVLALDDPRVEAFARGELDDPALTETCRRAIETHLRR